jgi:hypothetical protein
VGSGRKRENWDAGKPHPSFFVTILSLFDHGERSLSGVRFPNNPVVGEMEVVRSSAIQVEARNENHIESVSKGNPPTRLLNLNGNLAEPLGRLFLPNAGIDFHIDPHGLT